MINDNKIAEYMFWSDVLMECRENKDESAEEYCLDILDTCWWDMSLQERGVANVKILNLYSDKL